jgi:hypothetical protein
MSAVERLVELDRLRALLIAALGFVQLRDQSPEVAPLRRWLDSWAGLGAVLDGMVRQGYDVALTRNGDAGWRALFYPSSFIHESRAGAAWGTTPWKGRTGCGVDDARAQATGPVSKGKSRAPEPKEPAAKDTLSILPVQLQIGDRYSDETGEWEVVGHPFTTGGGKVVHARVRKVNEPGRHRGAGLGRA